MIDDLVFALGLVAIIEGLALALAPSRLRDVLELIERLDVDRRRMLGLLAVTLGVALMWFARG